MQEQKSGNCPLRGESRNIRASLDIVICRERTVFDWTILMGMLDGVTFSELGINA